MVELKKAKQKYKDQDIVKCLADGRLYEMNLNLVHNYHNEIWTYANNNVGSSIQLYDGKKWAKIISTKQNIYELW
jgi:hypothetical protein